MSDLLLAVVNLLAAIVKLEQTRLEALPPEQRAAFVQPTLQLRADLETFVHTHLPVQAPGSKPS